MQIENKEEQSAESYSVEHIYLCKQYVLLHGRTTGISKPMDNSVQKISFI